MGIPNSKFGQEVEKNELQEGSLPSTPILTPKTIKLSEMDPRSPSLHIARTPLELLSTAAEKLEVSDDTPIRNKRLILGIDPRSPTTEFKRTPIMINSSDGECSRKLHNKNLDNVRQTELQIKLTSEKKENFPKSAILPRLLQSSPIKPRSEAYKRRSLAGLLETNIDFTETDLDKVLQEKCRIITTEKNISTEEINGQNNLNISEIISNESIISPNEIEKTDENILEQFDDKVAIEDETASTDLEQSNKNDKEQEIRNATQSFQDVQIEATMHIPVQIKSAPVTPPKIPLSPILPSKEIKSAPITPPLVNLTADVKELDKKLTNLIYEDDLIVCPRIVKLKDTNERSPLRNCNGNEPRVKSGQKLKVSDKSRRSEYTVSKIPVFRVKTKVRNEVQCENTPPRNIEKQKPRHKKSDWDSKDNTLYL